MSSLKMIVIAPALLAGMLSCSSEPPPVAIPYRNDFSAANLGKEWTSRGGRWQIVDGRLFNDGARNVPLWLNARLPADVRVTFNAESRSPQVDLKFEIFGDGENHESGYVVILSGWSNSKSIIARLDEHGPERTSAVTATLRAEAHKDPDAAAATHRDRREILSRPHRSEPNRLYRFKLERRGTQMQFFVDDELHLDYFDPAPLSGPGNDRFAFNNWASLAFFDDLAIEPLRP